jgi:hypothetical protein
MRTRRGRENAQRFRRWKASDAHRWNRGAGRSGKEDSAADSLFVEKGGHLLGLGKAKNRFRHASKRAPADGLLAARLQ